MGLCLQNTPQGGYDNKPIKTETNETKTEKQAKTLGL